jgi:putative transposase
MTMKEHKAKLSLVELVTGEKDVQKDLMREALHTVLEGEMTKFLGTAPGERTERRQG